MASILYDAIVKQIERNQAIWRPSRYISVKRRTWRTLWLVKRTYRVPMWDDVVIGISMTYSEGGES